MSKRGKIKITTKTKLITASVITLVLIITGVVLWKQQQNMLTADIAKEPYSTVSVTEGSIASSTLLSGTVKALSEEYIYFDANKGNDATVTVKVGDQVTQGQQLVQYNTTTAQSAYDTAVRSLNKIGRQINHLKTYGVPAVSTETNKDEATGEETTTTVQPSAQQNANYKQQLQDLNDAYADAQAEVNKAQIALNGTVVISSVSGTVVEVNNDIDPSSKNSQTLVHVATEGQLQVKGTLTEYDLANVKVGQSVKIKSKVYSNQEWTGKISYVSNYPTESNAGSTTPAGSTGAGSSTGAAYDYKIDIISPLNQLKQGFTVSVEVVNEAKQALVPLTAVIKKDKKHYVWTYDDATGKAKKVEVTLGNADAQQQEIHKGVAVGDIVIANPDKNIKPDKKLEGVISTGTNTKPEKDSQSKNKKSGVDK
ncbi:efflux RND transporter periplasmic adaptor subunit [Streptococcus pyogenes]|uniref:efflux RND transporter periplasmic adaptor subunit n=1 Tax=Streptococcus pyogenes TaxID=1314 RepID=UPI0004D18044|nr:efflux RND transporter periplasmic adaptor subunit [Streptococcus pyogenes]AIG50188.1 ABC transporter substrate-binding protein [Streptococcus pyogenes STAB901]AIW11568.1 ABC transporter substrate-binding protein [Streptococcus pyogenes]OAC81786.1 efflux transporter periplasmic adaptor subunit [Streptococcus pyogenes]OAC84178.1 efflux transporter periplasmic adaptor subunit [Streptococcus pyogenes]OAC84880.1 efflux transporter periplasmic adaptor subunit [Streptococcus pyogenes]